MSTIVFRNVDRTHSVIVFFSSIFLLQTRIMEHLFRVTMRFWNSRDLINGWHCDTLIHHKSTCPARTKKHLQWSNMSKIQQKSKNYIPVIHNVYPSVCVCLCVCCAWMCLSIAMLRIWFSDLCGISHENTSNFHIVRRCQLPGVSHQTCDGGKSFGWLDDQTAEKEPTFFSSWGSTLK